MFAVGTAAAAEFGLAENSLGEFRSVRYENVYTKVPTTGKLVSIKITDSGKIFYICREQNGYAIYHLEIRAIEGYRDKINQELQQMSQNWDRLHPDELLFSKELRDKELVRKVHRYCEAVWVRNEIVVDEGQKAPARTQESRQ